MEKILFKSRILFGTLILLCVLFTVQVNVKASEEEDTAGASFGKEYDESQNYVSEDTDTYLYSDDVLTKSAVGWNQNSSGWWYQYSDGTYPVSAWIKIAGQWNYFDKNGYWVDTIKTSQYENNTVKGIDVSYYQGDIDWNSVLYDGVQFAFLRIGRSYYDNNGYHHYTDTRYEEYINDANTVGIPIGVYFYSKARSVGAAITDAQYVIKMLHGHTISYPVAIDLEDASQVDLSKQELGLIAKAFCDEIRKAGYTPMIYCNEDWYKNHIDISQIPDEEMWIARYNYKYDTNISRSIWQCSSKGKIAGIAGNVDIDFAYKNYSSIILPRQSSDLDYLPTRGWINNGGNWSYINEDGQVVTGWQYSWGDWYYFNSNGYMVTGWQYIGNTWYYLNVNGKMLTGWQYINGLWYYFDVNGSIHRGLLNSYGKWYYMNSDGQMSTGWQYTDGIWYYFDANGEMTTSWQYIGGKWYYMDSNGKMTTGWQYIWGKWYYMNSSGEMTTGWQYIWGKWYYMNSSGEMITGWKYIWGKWYYMNPSGEMIIG